MARYKLTVEYDGTPYAGWQRQKDMPTVQEALMNATFLFCGKQVDVVGAGRTDASVHATAQVAHIELETDMPAFKVMQGINYYLFNPPNNIIPDIGGGSLQNTKNIPHVASPVRDDKFWPENRIAILDAKRVPDDFHARFSAKKRHYLYRIINRRPRLGLESGRAWHVIEDLNEKTMQEAANILVGHHDFTSFRDTRCQSKSPEKTLEIFNVTRRNNEIHVVASARSFLHHQVRNMVGTLALVGKGKWSAQDVKVALEARDRSAGGPTAPPDGLYLTGVDY